MYSGGLELGRYSGEGRGLTYTESLEVVYSVLAAGTYDRRIMDTVDVCG